MYNFRVCVGNVENCNQPIINLNIIIKWQLFKLPIWYKLKGFLVLFPTDVFWEIA